MLAHFVRALRDTAGFLHVKLALFGASALTAMMLAQKLNLLRLFVFKGGSEAFVTSLVL